MMRSPSVNLCFDITRKDALMIMEWLKDNEVTKYLNESPNISASINDVLNRVNLPTLTHLFNKNGRLLMIRTDNNQPVGFIKLADKAGETEIVIVIGNRDKWGKGIGTRAVRESIKHAFFEMRSRKVIAKIHSENTRSVEVFKKAGFGLEKEYSSIKRFSITMDDYIKSITSRRTEVDA